MRRRHHPLRALALGAMVAAASSAAAQAAPTVTSTTIGSGSADPVHVAAGPDGRTWVTLAGPPARIAGVAEDGTVTTYGTNATLPDAASPFAIATGPDLNLWFTASGNPARLGRITPSGTISLFTSGLTAGGQPTSLSRGPDGRLWFTEVASGRIGRVDVSGTVTEFSSGLPGNARPTGITVGPDGALWFVEAVADGRVGRITTQGQVSFRTLTGLTGFTPRDIVAGRDGSLHVAADKAGDGVVAHLVPGGTTSTSTSLGSGVAAVSLTTGVDDALWLSLGTRHEIGRLDADGVLTRLAVPGAATPRGIGLGPDGNVAVALEGPDGLGRISSPPGLPAAPVVTPEADRADLAVRVHPAHQATTVRAQYGTTTAYGRLGETAAVGPATTERDLTLRLEGLEPATTYHVRAVATNASGTTSGPDATFTTPPRRAPDGEDGPDDRGSGDDQLRTPFTPADPAPGLPAAIPPPVLGRTMVVREERGTVRIQPGGRGGFVDLARAGGAMPVGSVVDTRQGTVALTTVRDATGATQTGTFSRGLFEVRQSRTDGYTELRLRGGSFQCPRRPVARAAGLRAVAAAAKRAKVVRSLWGDDDHGRFRTRGRDSVATVRGTSWRTEDRCDGTLTTVTAGAVSVQELRRGGVRRTVTAGHRHLAPH